MRWSRVSGFLYRDYSISTDCFFAPIFSRLENAALLGHTPHLILQGGTNGDGVDAITNAVRGADGY